MKNPIQKIFFVATLFFLIFISCKKDSFSLQEGLYLGIGHIEQSYWRSDFIPIHPDSMINDRGDFTEVFFPISVDSVFVDTFLVEVSNDSIFFNGGLRFPVNKESIYKMSYPGYTFYTYTIRQDSLLIDENYVIDRGGPRPGTGRFTFKGLKR